MAAGKPLAGARVILYAGSASGASELGHATAGSSGTFAIAYTSPPSAGLLYVDATPRHSSWLQLRAIVGLGSGGAVSRQTLSSVTINELTTIAAGYALGQFSDTSGVSGPSPALENAAATAYNLADSSDGRAAAVVTNANNGGATTRSRRLTRSPISSRSAPQRRTRARAVSCSGWPRHRARVPRPTPWRRLSIWPGTDTGACRAVPAAIRPPTDTSVG